jgi:site-specific recombinase XerD
MRDEDEGSGPSADDSTVVQYHRTSLARASTLDCALDATGALSRAGVRDSQPFVLGADGSYDIALNRFFQELDGWGVRSANGIAAYTRDVMLFCRFLHEGRGGKTIWECDAADLLAYKRIRLWGDGPDRVSISTWRRSIAALDKWVRWSIAEGLLQEEPFRYLDRLVMTPQGPKQMRVNAQQEPDPPVKPIQFLPFEDFLLWRNVGLRGELPDGTIDPTWRGRHGERNALFADVLVYTGMRLGEAASMLACEVPQLTERSAGAFQVPSAVAKRGKGRTVFINTRTLRGLHQYLEIERDELVTRCRARGYYDRMTDPVGVRSAGRYALTLEEGKRSWAYAKIDADRRRHLTWMVGGHSSGPLLLWLGDRGEPVLPSTWQSIFRRANKRCAKLGIPLEVHPHTLRHTFAVHMLGLLLRQTVRALGKRENPQVTRAELKRLLIGNPMRKLQLLLGHSNESTVYTYLDVLDEAQEIVMAALAEWDEQSAALGLPASEVATA